MGASYVYLPRPLFSAADHVYGSGPHEQVPRLVKFAYAAGGQRVHARGKAGTVFRPRLIVLPVARHFTVAEVVGKQRHHRYHVRLFYDLGRARHAVVSAPVFPFIHETAAHRA